MAYTPLNLQDFDEDHPWQKEYVDHIEDELTLLDDKLSAIGDAAYSHNTQYRGKSLGSSVSSAQHTAMNGGTFDDLYIGDYWTISSANYRIGSFNYKIRTGSSASLTTNHALIVRDTNFYTAPMNATNTTEGGYIGSAMYTGEEITVSGTAYTGLTNAISTIESAFGSYLVEFEPYLTNAVTNGYPSGGAWVTGVKALLMSENMVYGGPIRKQMSSGGTNYSLAQTDKNILPLFLFAPYYQNIRSSYWLRDVVSAASFAFVSATGTANSSNASGVYGVRPFFLIS